MCCYLCITPKVVLPIVCVCVVGCLIPFVVTQGHRAQPVLHRCTDSLTHTVRKTHNLHVRHGIECDVKASAITIHEYQVGRGNSSIDKEIELEQVYKNAHHYAHLRL